MWTKISYNSTGIPCGWPVHRSHHWAGADEKYKNQWWPHKRARYDGAATIDMAVLHASLCWSQQCHARADKGEPQHWRAEQGHDRCKTSTWQEEHIHSHNYLQQRHPFCSNPSLHSVSTGVHAHPPVNVDKVKAIENTILASMDGQTTADYTFKKKD